MLYNITNIDLKTLRMMIESIESTNPNFIEWVEYGNRAKIDGVTLDYILEAARRYYDMKQDKVE